MLMITLKKAADFDKVCEAFDAERAKRQMERAAEKAARDEKRAAEKLARQEKRATERAAREAEKATKEEKSGDHDTEAETAKVAMTAVEAVVDVAQ